MTRRELPYHVIIKITSIQNKERVLRSAREKQQHIYTGKTIRMAADLSTEMKAKRKWRDIFQTLKENNCQYQLLYSTKLPFRIKEEIRTY
jgi:hypothetical protein